MCVCVCGNRFFLSESLPPVMKSHTAPDSRTTTPPTETPFLKPSPIPELSKPENPKLEVKNSKTEFQNRFRYSFTLLESFYATIWILN